MKTFIVILIESNRISSLFEGQTKEMQTAKVMTNLWVCRSVSQDGRRL